MLLAPEDAAGVVAEVELPVSVEFPVLVEFPVFVELPAVEFVALFALPPLPAKMGKELARTTALVFPVDELVQSLRVYVVLNKDALPISADVRVGTMYSWLF